MLRQEFQLDLFAYTESIPKLTLYAIGRVNCKSNSLITYRYLNREKTKVNASIDETQIFDSKRKAEQSLFGVNRLLRQEFRLRVIEIPEKELNILREQSTI